MNKKELLYDPTLKDAMKEIKEILEEYDIGGMIVLFSRTHGEFLHHYPTWSIVKYSEGISGYLDLCSDHSNYQNKEEQYQALKSSVNMILGTKNICKSVMTVCQNIIQSLKEHLDITEHSMDFTNSPTEFEI